MAEAGRLRSRRQRVALAAAAFLVALFCAAAEARLRWNGVRRDALWTGGIVVYGALLKAASGSPIDRRREPLPRDASGSLDRRRASR
ncbi:MAG TPA: hypothetical protein VG777_08020 [Thermoanaerobaculia bacterium]|nr:hypothetical protein [Thermoanaerobaculia bacterium]